MKRFHHSGLNLVLAIAMLFNYSGLAQAVVNPDLPEFANTGNWDGNHVAKAVVAGSAKFDFDPGRLNITAADKTIIEYNKFNIAAGKTVEFYQPSSTATVLNRVIGVGSGAASTIAGSLKANGRVFLINSNGILFTSSSRVNVAGLVASTMNISNDDFKYGSPYTFTRGTSNGNIINQGAITIKNGGFVALLSPEIRNLGNISIEAALGQIILASGNKATLRLDSDGDISVVIDEGLKSTLTGQTAAITNTGTLEADGGTIILTAKVLGQVLDSAINNTGVIQANRLSYKDGEVILSADSNVKIGGTISALSGDVRVDSEGAVYNGTIKADNGVFDSHAGDTFLSGTYSGDMTWLDDINIFVNGDLTVTGGDLVIRADNNNYLAGDFVQNAGTTIKGDDDITIKGVNVTLGSIEADDYLQVDATRGDVVHRYGSTITANDFRGYAHNNYILLAGSSLDTGDGIIDIKAGQDIFLSKGDAILYDWNYVSGSRGYKFTEFGYYVHDGDGLTLYALVTGEDIGNDGSSSGSGEFYLDGDLPLLLYGIFADGTKPVPAVYEEAGLNADGKAHVQAYEGPGCGDGTACVGFEDIVAGSDYDYNDAVIDMPYERFTGVTLSGGDVFLTAVNGGIHQKGGIVNAEALMLSTNKGMEGIGQNGGLLVSTKYLSAFNRSSGDILVDDIEREEEGKKFCFFGGDDVDGLTVKNLIWNDGLNSGVRGTEGVVNNANGGTIDLMTEGDLDVYADILGHGNISLLATDDIFQDEDGDITIDQDDASLSGLPTNVHSTSHNPDVWEFGVSNDNTIDVEWNLPGTNKELYSFVAVAGDAYKQDRCAKVETNGGAADILAGGNVTLALIDAGNGVVNITSSEGAIIDGDLSHVAWDYDVIGNTIHLNAETVGGEGHGEEIDLGAPSVKFSYAWSNGQSTPDNTPDSYLRTYDPVTGKWVFSTTSPVLFDAADWYFNVKTVSGKLPKFMLFSEEGDGGSDPSTVSVGPFFIDATAPVITVGFEEGLKNIDGTWFPDVFVSFDAADNLSGFDPLGVLNLPGFSTGKTSGVGEGLIVTSSGIYDRAGNWAGPISMSYTVVPPPQMGLLLAQKFLYPHVEQLSLKQVNPADGITSAGLNIMGQPFHYHPLTQVDDGAYNGFQLEEGAYDFIDGQIDPCDPTGKNGKPCKKQ